MTAPAQFPLPALVPTTRAATALALFGLVACGGETSPATPSIDTDGTTTDDVGDSGTADEDSGGDASVVASCRYVSPFTQGNECREYLGSGWTDGDVADDCDSVSGTLAAGEACEPDGALGRCVLESGADRVIEVVAYGDDSGACATQALGCETFGGGSWEPSPLCDDDPGGGSNGSVFIPPTLECRDPLPGEPPGNGPGGQVCTWQSISGCTEEGRYFADYASCEVVLSQRPYYPSPPAEGWDQDDPRLQDAAYAGELAWVRSQLEASACVCCHSDLAPNGASNWTLDQEGNFMHGFFDTGLAMGAGWIDSTAFGSYPPEDNNGFERHSVGFPSTDPERMRSFLVAELQHRGLSEADFADTEPFGGPLYDQLVYEPSACEGGEGVRRDGTVVWDGADARYVYVLDESSANPTVPPNLDLPEGTRWRVDVPPDGDPIASGTITYGELPAGTTQRFPTEGQPAALSPGQTYYLYVTRDVGLPITRCLFTF